MTSSYFHYKVVMRNQCSMILFWVSLLGIGTINIHAARLRPVSDICANVDCPNNGVCRVVRHCHRTQCNPEFACIPCIPAGVDEECQLQNLTRAVLFGDPSKPRMLIPLDCNNGRTCPPGSTCVKLTGDVTKGNCCYGPASDPSSENNDKKCLLCTPECIEGFQCEEVTDECEETKNVCQPLPKPGRCRPPKKIEKCGPQDKKRNCLHDRACPYQNKCCENACGGFDCRYPLPEL